MFYFITKTLKTEKQLIKIFCPLSHFFSTIHERSSPHSYTLNAASEGTAGLASNPEVRVSSAAAVASAPGSSAQADALRTLTARLKDAYNGVEVQWLDTDTKGKFLRFSLHFL